MRHRGVLSTISFQSPRLPGIRASRASLRPLSISIPHGISPVPSRRLQSTSSTLPSPSIPTKHRLPPKYNWIPGVESLDRYEPGGYYPVALGDVLNARYRVVDKLGSGGYSTVWLARDTAANRYVAIKIGIADSESTRLEVETIQALSTPLHPPSALGLGRRFMPSVLDEFQVQGPNGRHSCYVTTPASGSLRSSRECGVFKLDVARALAGKLALAVAYMHTRGYAHGDLHLGNVLAKPPSTFDHLSVEQFYKEHGDPEVVPIGLRDGSALPPGVPEHGVKPLDLSIAARDFELSDARIVLSDFGESYKPSEGRRLGKDCNTPGYLRPPDAHLAPDAPLTHAADVWTLGLAIWDCVSMQSVFSNDGATPDELVSQAVDVLGPLPEEWRGRWAARQAEYFDEDGRRRNVGQMLWSSLDEAYEQGCRKYREAREAGIFDEQHERPAFLHLIRGMLAFLPQDRVSAKEVLESEWMVKWVMPDVERSLQAGESKNPQA